MLGSSKTYIIGKTGYGKSSYFLNTFFGLRNNLIFEVGETDDSITMIASNQITEYESVKLNLIDTRIAVNKSGWNKHFVMSKKKKPPDLSSELE